MKTSNLAEQIDKLEAEFGAGSIAKLKGN